RVPPSELLAAQPLANHVELVEAGVTERDLPALGAVPDRDLEAEQVAQLPLERGDVGPGALIFDREALLARRLAGGRQFLRLADGKAAAQHLVGQAFR